MFHIVLYQPEIPPNTGNIIRLCANTGAQLHLIEPLGFEIDDKQLKRAGLDYHTLVNLRVYKDFAACKEELGSARLFALSSKGHLSYDKPRFQKGDAFIFGPETRGLSAAFLADFPAEAVLKIPQTTKTRSLNLSNAAAVMVYEAWRQQNFISS